MKTFRQYFTLLKEGGNLFEGTRRINKSEVVPTIKQLEVITGLPLLSNMLGSTGKAETSGDIDLGVDANTITKDELIQRLVSAGAASQDMKKTGIEVGYKAPIYKNNKELAGGFVQVDFMFHAQLPYLLWFYANNEKLPLKGKDRNILLSSIAKSRNLTISVNGLSNRETKQLITYDPNEIAKAIFDKNATEKDIHDIPRLINYLKKIYKNDLNAIKQIVAPAEETSGVVYI
jgi:hypothetical protein